MSHPIHALERALQNWEDNCLFYRAGAAVGFKDLEGRPLVVAGPLVHYREFRRYLLEVRRDSIFDEPRFIGPEAVSGLLVKESVIIEDLFRWTRSSRRAFRLSAELSTLLQCTDMKSSSWSDMKLPFDSFALLLDEPIMTRGEVLVEALLISRVTAAESVVGHELIRLVYLTPEIGVWSSFERKQVYKLLARMDSRRLHAELEKLAARYHSKQGFGVTYIDPSLLAGASIAESPTRTMMTRDQTGAFSLMSDDGAVDDYDLMSRLVATFCLYLNTLPVGSSHLSSWRGLSGNARSDPRAVINEAQICCVSSTHKLDATEVRLLSEHRSGGRSTYELCAHWRRGHFRRPPGSGDDPSAPRTIWVRPTLVRRDRIAPGELPGGCETIVR